MDTIVKRLLESHRIDEVRKKEALNSIADELDKLLSKVKGYSHHKLSINPNYDEGCVDIEFKGNDDKFRVYPQKSKISNENSSKVIKVSDIDGAYIIGTTVYNSDDEEIGEALIRMKATHNKSDYSNSLDKAEYVFNSKITNLRRLEKYIAKDAINKMK